MPDPALPRPIPPLRPPATGAERAVDRARHLWVWLGLILLAILGLAVVLLLPRWVPGPGGPAQDQPTLSVAPVTSAAPPEAAGITEPSAERAAADWGLQAYLRSAARLELARAPIWGEPEWSQAARSAAQADRHYEQSGFLEAAQRYRQAEQQLQALEAERQPRLTAALAAGRQALAQDDAQAAEAQFQLALAIEPEDPDATRGLARAKARPALSALMQTARQAEAQGDLASALNAYREAARLDPDYPAAITARERVTNELTEAGFGKAMSQVLSALREGRLEGAAEALQRAAQLKPEDPAVADARQRLASGRKQARLAQLRRDAESRARAEDWEGAASLYQQALQRERNAAFARQGLERARERQQINRQIDRYIKEPDRLSSREPRANAGHLLTSVHAGPEEPQLKKKLAKLERLVTQARTPVPVLLHSDGQTEVVIYHVGRLGRFQQRSLELLPGRYTAVGSRDGYRDVRREFIVQADRLPAPVLVRCEETL